MNGLNKKQVIAAAILIIMSLSTVAYASLNLGVGVPIDAVDVSLVGVSDIRHIPARTVYTEEYSDGQSGLNVTGLDGLAEVISCG